MDDAACTWLVGEEPGANAYPQWRRSLCFRHRRDALLAGDSDSDSDRGTADRGDGCEVAAPHGLDLFNLILRPTPRFSSEKLRLYQERQRAKRWVKAWPGLKPSGAASQPRQG